MTIFLILAAVSCAGCLVPVPIAVFPAPSLGSGKFIVFRGIGGKSIHCEGWVVVQRSRTWIGDDQSSQLLRVNDGVARIPQETVLASVWLRPNSMAWVLLAAMFVHPINIVSAPILVIPDPAIAPEESLWLIPLVPGYFLVNENWNPSINSMWRFHWYGKSNEITVPLVEDKFGLARQYWSGAKRAICGTDDSKHDTLAFDVILEPRDLALARAIINAELRHLMFQKPSSATSRPAGNGASKRPSP